jgi:aldehyde dehydrogenase (NAD+)
MSTDAHQADPIALDDDRRTQILADVAALRDSFERGTTRPVEARLAQLDALRRGLRAERPRLVKALAADLGKSRTESALTELGVVAQEIAHTRRNLRSWLRPRRFGPGLLLAPATGEIRREPLGTTLIIAPWNYPVNLALAPLIGAIAGGNTALLKPSEVAPSSSASTSSSTPATAPSVGSWRARPPST